MTPLDPPGEVQDAEDVERVAKRLHDLHCGCSRGVTENWRQTARDVLGLSDSGEGQASS